MAQQLFHHALLVLAAEAEQVPVVMSAVEQGVGPAKPRSDRGHTPVV